MQLGGVANIETYITVVLTTLFVAIPLAILRILGIAIRLDPAPSPFYDESVVLCIVLTVTEVIAAVVSLLFVRGCGYRLVRPPS